MDEPNRDLAKQLSSIGISESYASQLANSPPRRTPSLKLALKIHEKLGIRMGPLVGIDPRHIAVAEKIQEATAEQIAQRKAG